MRRQTEECATRVRYAAAPHGLVLMVRMARLVSLARSASRRRLLSPLEALLLCALAASCASDTALPGGTPTSVAGAPSASAAAAGAAGSQPSAAGAAATSGKLSFANDVFPKVIRSKCGACHNDAPSFGGLAFFPGGPEVAYMNLVNMPAGDQEGWKCKGSGLVRVQPGDPEHSLMYLKLTSPPCGSKMPPGAFGMATPEQVELVRQWIADGAAP